MAAGGNCTIATRYCLSCCGMKPPGTAYEAEARQRDQAGVDRDRDAAPTDRRGHRLRVRIAGALEAAIEAREEAAEHLSMPRVSAVRLARRAA